MAYTETPGKSKYGREYTVITVPWTSDGSGNYTETIPICGWLVKSVTDPGNGPTDNYDITLVQNTADQLSGALADRDTTNGEVVIHASPIFLAGDHTFTIANAGASKTGTAYFYILEEL